MKIPFVLLMILTVLCQIGCDPTQQPIAPATNTPDLGGIWKISEVKTLGYFDQQNDWYSQDNPSSNWVYHADSTASLQFSFRPRNLDSVVYHFHWSGIWLYDSTSNQIELTGNETSVLEDETTNLQTPQPDHDIDLTFKIESLQNDSLELTTTFRERETYWHFFLYKE